MQTPHLHEHLLQLQRQILRRRQLLAWMGGAALLPACGGGGTGTTSSTTTPTPPSTPGTGSCSLVPEETAGPYPGDGSNSSGGQIANALALAGIVRRDMRSSIAGASGVAAGLPLTVNLQLVNVNGSCASLADYAIYLWHCDREGRYSMYSAGVTAENYLRAVQASGSDGRLSFQTIFPGCYDGRMPHMHFEVFRSTSQASQFSNKIRTSQLAFPTDICQAVYNGVAGYETSRTNFARISFASDNVFSDGVSLQLATLSGDLTNGYTATLTVGVNA
ncbi:intradiol ring-cleavage dioxygenase [Inhella sp.]|uniref:dioxygenase family protein n=1 Tax=Inhella sp. TaxID=1921806 RepID=UPI0035B4A0B6